MLSNLTICKAAALALGAATIVICAPVASADDPPACAPDDQQCQEQQKQPDPAQIAGQVADNVQEGIDRANEAKDSGVDLASTKCVMIDGIPRIIPPEGLYLGTGPHQTGLPCFMQFGLEPHN